MSIPNINNIQALAADLANKNVGTFADVGAPTNGTSGTAVGLAGTGSLYVDTATGDEYFNFGTLASPTWLLISGSRIGFVAETTITSAQIKAIRATPIQVAAAPGAGKAMNFTGGILIPKYGGTNPFTGAQNLQVKYTNGAGPVASASITGAGLIDQSVSMMSSIAQAQTALTKAQTDNQAFVLHNTGAAEITGNAAGDNTFLVKIYYTVQTPGW